MIVVMGAAGATGNALVHRLTTAGIHCRALSRDPDRLRANMNAVNTVDVRYADATDPASLRAAFEGASQLFLTMTNSPAQIELETRVIAIAAESGIAHIVKLSAPTAREDSPLLSRGGTTPSRRLFATPASSTRSCGPTPSCRSCCC